MSPSRVRVTRRGRRLAVAAGALVALVLTAPLLAGRPGEREPDGAAATSPSAATPTGTPTPPVATWRPAVAAPVTEDLVHLAPAELVVDAPVVVVADVRRRLERDLGAWLATRLQAPLLDGGRALPDDVELVVAVGDVALPTGAAVEVRRVRASDPSGPVPALADRRSAARVATMPARTRPPVAADVAVVSDLLAAADVAASSGVTLVVRADTVPAADVVTAVALGHDVVVARTPALWEDPRVAAAVGRPGRTVALLGEGWAGADGERLARQLAATRRGDELPGGGYTLFPHRRLVGLYGHPDGPALGVLGEQPPDAAVARARAQAAAYAELVDVPVVPVFDLIATVASARPEPTGDYSRRTPVDRLRPWVGAAGAAGVYVLLDLQPGRTDFLTQAREYEALLREPHVGLALDPEWRLTPDGVHLRRVGSVSGDEVDAVASWLAGLVRRHRLPQKLLVVHQFTPAMVRDRERIDATRDEVAVVIHMDGQGSQGAKLETYRRLQQDAPPGVRWGWKNFHDEDVPTRSPGDTVALEPSPVLVTYQ